MNDGPLLMRLEVVSLPVSDVDRAKEFYAERLGFNVDIDHQVSDTVRLVQLTPPGSACSIHIGMGLPEVSTLSPGSVKRLHLVVEDVARVRTTLIERGVEVNEIEEHRKGVKLAHLSDPDGNSWVLQEIPPHS